MLLLYAVTGLLATSCLVGGEADCPSACTCETEGSSGISAKCSAFNLTQHFDIEVAFLDLSNIPESTGLRLTDQIFAKAGLRDVSSLTIVNSSLNEIDTHAFNGLHNLYYLNLTGNHLGLLEPDMFANNTHLEILSLNQNPLKFMQVEKSPYKEYFLNIPSLQELYLSKCSLSHLLPTVFARLTTVVSVDLAYNAIENIDQDTFAPLFDLESLDLSHNKLTYLSLDMFQNNLELADLYLQGNPLTTLSGLTIENLQKLDISLCDFSFIDETTFSGLTKLRNLNLAGNVVTSLNSNPFKSLKKLQFLDISNNRLVGPVPDDVFINNPQLETIKLQNNPQIRMLPETGFKGEFSELYLLDASNCGLTQLGEQSLKNMNRLAHLDLSDNHIEYLQPGVLPSRIINLDLTNNNIAHLKDVSFPAGSWLRKLYVSGNPVEKFSPNAFINTTRLKKLYLKSCNLKHLLDLSDEKMQPMNSLMFLNVENNRIEDVSIKELSYIERVQTLILAGNPLNCTDSVKKSVKYLIQNRVTSTEAKEKKILEELVGKTELSEDRLGWNSLLSQICVNKQNIIDKLTSDYHYFETTYGEDVDIETTGYTEIDYTNTDDWEDGWTIPSNSEGEIQKEHVVPSTINYVWVIVMFAFSSFLIIAMLLLLAVFLLKWNRQKNSYRNRILKHHSLGGVSKLKRGSSTVYQQLYEDPNTPTTPVMPAKLSEQKIYSFPEKPTNEMTEATAQTNNKASYLCSPFHHSNIVPESV